MLTFNASKRSALGFDGLVAQGPTAAQMLEHRWLGKNAEAERKIMKTFLFS